MVRSPNDRGLIHKLENSIKKNWTYYSPEKPFNYMAFSETFSVVLMKIESKQIKKQIELSRFFKNHYRKTYDDLALSVTKVDGVSHQELIRKSRLLFKDCSPSDYLIIFKYLNDPKSTKTEKVLKILSKIRYNSQFDNNTLLDVVSKCNFISLYLIDEMGFKKYKEFTDLVDSLGMYYPYSQLPDSELVLKIKDRILTKFMDSISNNTSEANLEALEKLLY